MRHGRSCCRKARSSRQALTCPESGSSALSRALATAVPKATEQMIRIPPSTSRRNKGGQTPLGSGGSGRAAVSVFLESGESLKITQTASGLFISFDRAVVEEYRFGENRLVSVGPIEAQRVSGWEGSRFVNETLDKGGAILAESWELASGGSVLIRTISLRQGEDRIFSSEQRFDRR